MFLRFFLLFRLMLWVCTVMHHYTSCLLEVHRVFFFSLCIILGKAFHNIKTFLTSIYTSTFVTSSYNFCALMTHTDDDLFVWSWNECFSVFTLMHASRFLCGFFFIIIISYQYFYTLSVTKKRKISALFDKTNTILLKWRQRNMQSWCLEWWWI